MTSVWVVIEYVEEPCGDPVASVCAVFSDESRATAFAKARAADVLEFTLDAENE